MGTFLVGAILILLVGLSVRSMRNAKKNGRSHCGGDCGKCGGCR